MLLAVYAVAIVVPVTSLTEASHTYAASGSFSIGSAYGMSGGGRNIPHPVFGYTYGPEGATLLYGCNVGVTNMRTGESVVAETTPYDAVYVIDMNQFYLGWMFGDILKVTATKGDTYFGWAEGQVTDTPSGYDQIDVMLNLAPQPTEVTITLTVTDAIGQTDSVSKTVLLRALEPPMALISCPMDYMSVTVDGSCSIAPYGTIVSYDWTFGDGGVASGITADHTYVAPGTYLITLTVTDSEGLTESSSVQVTVPLTPGPP
jgi:hypothetical protein